MCMVRMHQWAHLVNTGRGGGRVGREGGRGRDGEGEGEKEDASELNARGFPGWDLPTCLDLSAPGIERPMLHRNFVSPSSSVHMYVV